MDHPVPPPPTAPPSLAFNVTSPLSLTRSRYLLPSWIIFHLDYVPTRHSLVSNACLCAPRRVPASASVSRVHSPHPCRSWPVPRSLSVPGGVVRRWSLRVYVYLPISLPVCIVVSYHIWCLIYFLLGWSFLHAKTKGPGASTTCQSLSPVLALTS